MKIRTVMPALAMTSALVLAGCGGDTSPDGAGSGGTPSASSSPTPSTTAQDHSTDVAFSHNMYPHHAQATEMAALAQERTDNTAVLELATQIEQAQSPEMEQMTQLLDSLGQPAPSTAMGTMEQMDPGSGASSGMVSEQDMASLRAASGAQFDRMWLTMMIEHHTGAIEMARTELEDGTNAQARQLASEIAEAQQAEVTTMEGLIDPS